VTLPEVEDEDEEGTLQNFYIYVDVSFWGPIVYMGIFAATLSSGLASLIGAPRIFQAVCKDNLFPKYPFSWFAEDGCWNGKWWWRKSNEPIRGYFLTFVVAAIFIGIGSLNAIAPIISMFFMITYGLINLACFASSLYKVPGWRPTFKLYNKWVSLFGALLCLVAMFIISWWSALICGVIAVFIYWYLSKKEPDVNWGPAADIFKTTYLIKNLYGLRKMKEHVKNYRPNYLVLVGDPDDNPEMIKFAEFLKKGRGLILCAQVVVGDYRENVVNYDEYRGNGYLCTDKLKSAFDVIISESTRAGVQTLFQTSGIGKLKPNTVCIGFKDQWRTDNEETLGKNPTFKAKINKQFLASFGFVSKFSNF